MGLCTLFLVLGTGNSALLKKGWAGERCPKKVCFWTFFFWLNEVFFLLGGAGEETHI